MLSPSLAAGANPVGLEAGTVRDAAGHGLFTAAHALLLATLLAAPLAFGAVQAWAWVSLELLVLLAFLLWALGGVRQRVLRIRWSPLYLPAALFLILGGVQYWGHFSLDPVATRESLLKFTTDLVLLFLATQLLAIDSGRTLARLGFAVASYAFALGLFAILQYSSSNGRIYWTVKANGWTFGPYVNHDHYAGLMEMLIPIVAGYLLSRPEKDQARAALGFALLVQIASLLLSGSRGGLIALLTEVLIFGSVLLVTYRRQGRHSPIAIVALGLTAAAALFFWLDPGEISKRLATTFAAPRSPEATLGDRLAMAQDSLRIVRGRPWMGVGLGSFENVYPQYQSFASDFAIGHAHNDYVEALAETGLAGGALIVLALAIFLRRAFSHLQERLRREAGWIQLGATVGCCGLLVHSLADFNLHIPANAAWFCVSLAVALSGSACRSDVRS